MRTPCIVLVDPVSTGACVARDAVARGYHVVRLWSKELSQELREFLPDGCQVEYLATVEEADTIKATAKRLLAIFTPDAIICGAETGVLLTAPSLTPPPQTHPLQS